MLSLKDEGSPIAIVSGGPKDKKIVDIISPFDRAFKPDGKKSMVIVDAVFEPVPSEKREIIYACGPSGAGKSTWIANYTKNFKKMNPDSKVILFSRLSEDKVFDDLNVARIPINDEFLEEPIDIHEEVPENSLCIFDDCSTIPDDKLKTEVYKVMLDILETGRHRNIFCCVTNHLFNNGKDRVINRTIYNEMNRLVLFPSLSSRPTMHKILDEHWGLEKKKRTKILGYPSRWVCIGKNVPQYCMFENAIKTL